MVGVADTIAPPAAAWPWRARSGQPLLSRCDSAGSRGQPGEASHRGLALNATSVDFRTVPGWKCISPGIRCSAETGGQM